MHLCTSGGHPLDSPPNPAPGSRPHLRAQVVEPKKAIVDVDVAKAEEAASAANAIKEECEGALAEAMPILVGGGAAGGDGHGRGHGWGCTALS